MIEKLASIATLASRAGMRSVDHVGQVIASDPDGAEQSTPPVHRRKCETHRASRGHQMPAKDDSLGRESARNR